MIPESLLNGDNFTIQNSHFLYIYMRTFCPLAFSVLSKIKDEDAKVKEFLLSFYREIETCYDDLDDNIQTLLKKKMGNVKEKMKSNQIKMKKEDYYLLVAGTFNCIIS